MTLPVIIILILVGLLFLLLEILVLPGTTVAGFIGFAVIGVAIWQAFDVYGSTAGFITLGASLFLTFIILGLSLKAKTWKRLALHSESDGKVNVIDEEKISVGDSGVTVSRLVPAGKALINNEFYEVHSLGEFIDENTEIEVVKIEFNNIKVKIKSKPNQ